MERDLIGCGGLASDPDRPFGAPAPRPAPPISSARRRSRFDMTPAPIDTQGENR